MYVVRVQDLESGAEKRQGSANAYIIRKLSNREGELLKRRRFRLRSEKNRALRVLVLVKAVLMRKDNVYSTSLSALALYPCL